MEALDLVVVGPPSSASDLESMHRLSSNKSLPSYWLGVTIISNLAIQNLRYSRDIASCTESGYGSNLQRQHSC